MATAWEFGPQNITPPISSDIGAALTVYKDKLYVAWRGSDGNTRVYLSSFDGHSWSPESWLASFDGPVGVAIAPYRGSLFAIGRRNNQELHWSRFDGKMWTGLEWYQRNHSSNEVALTPYRGLLFMICKGGQGDNAIYCGTYDG